MSEKIVRALPKEQQEKIQYEIERMTFTKNFCSSTAEEWYIFLPSYKEPQTGGAAGKAIIHYNLYGNKEIFINTTIIMDDLALHNTKNSTLLYAICEELVNRLVGYADTLLSVHAGTNSYEAEYKS